MNRLKEMRLAKGWSQAQVAKKLNCTDVTVSRYEMGKRGIDSEAIDKICDIFGCTADYLLGRSAIRSPDVSDEEYQLLELYRRLNPTGRDYVAQSLEMASRLYSEKNNAVSDMETAQ